MTSPDLDDLLEWNDQLDAAFSTLADEHHRHVLRYFLQTDDDVASLEDLVDHVLARADSAGDWERLACRFHHATLPKLDDAGFVEYDPRNNTVRYRPDSVVERLLDRADLTADE